MSTRRRPSAANLGVPPRSFEELNSLHPLRPIHDDVDLENAQEFSDALAILRKRSRDQEDYLETLSTLIEKYEAEQDVFSEDERELTTVDILRRLMEGREMSASDLGRVIGNRELGAAVLRGDRQLSKANILKLAEHFAVSPALFLR
jgi:HTH-type transcriptional regulator / antitoxin HigA